MSNVEKKIIQEIAQGLYPLVGAHLMTSGKFIKFEVYDDTPTNSVSISVTELSPESGLSVQSVSTRITYEMVKKYPELNEMVFTGLIRDLVGLDTYDMLLEIVNENSDRITKAK